MTKNNGMESLLYAVNAAKGGDLTVRAEETSSALAPLARAFNEMLDALSGQASQIAGSATRPCRPRKGSGAPTRRWPKASLTSRRPSLRSRAS